MWLVSGKRRVLPLALIFVGLYLLAGCIYVPTFQLSKSGPDFRGKVGDANSKKLIRPGAVTRAYVTQLLGPPQDATRDGRTVAYITGATDGYWVWPICFAANPAESWYRLELHFDAGDQLESYEVTKREIGAPLMLGMRRAHVRNLGPFDPLETPVRSLPIDVAAPVAP